MEKNLRSTGFNSPISHRRNADPESKSDVPKVTRSAKVAELEFEPGLQDFL